MSAMNAPRNLGTSAELDVSATTLWQLISDFPHIDRWAELRVLSVVGDGIGCERTVEMGTGAQVTERLVARDDERMTLVYEAVEPNPFPLRDYRSTIAIEALDAGRCRLIWSGVFTVPEGADPARSDRLLLKIYEGGIALLRDYFSKRAA